MGSSWSARQWPEPKHTRHVWLKPDGQLAPPVQGFVLEWRRSRRRWVALVVYVIDGGGGGPVSLQRWCRLEQLTPVRSSPNDRSG